MTTELEALRQKVAEAVARRQNVTHPWECDVALCNSGFHGESSYYQAIGPRIELTGPPGSIQAEADKDFMEAHHTDIETMQALLARLEALEAENNPALAVLKHIVENRCEEPLAFIEAWYEGNFDALREEWDGVPDAVFDGADPLFKRNSHDQN